ncbi:MAG: NADH-quinone oxidoreductase subunit I [Bacilli bacterium]
MRAEWLLSGLASGRVTTTYPRQREQELSRRRWNSIPTMNGPCSDTACRECSEVCPTEAITRAEAQGDAALRLDVGACIACGRCVDRCPEGVFSWTEAIDRAEVRKQRFISTMGRGADQ